MAEPLPPPPDFNAPWDALVVRYPALQSDIEAARKVDLSPDEVEQDVSVRMSGARKAFFKLAKMDGLDDLQANQRALQEVQESLANESPRMGRIRQNRFVQATGDMLAPQHEATAATGGLITNPSWSALGNALRAQGAAALAPVQGTPFEAGFHKAQALADRLTQHGREMGRDFYGELERVLGTTENMRQFLEVNPDLRPFMEMISMSRLPSGSTPITPHMAGAAGAIRGGGFYAGLSQLGQPSSEFADPEEIAAAQRVDPDIAAKTAAVEALSSLTGPEDMGLAALARAPALRKAALGALQSDVMTPVHRIRDRGQVRAAVDGELPKYVKPGRKGERPAGELVDELPDYDPQFAADLGQTVAREKSILAQRRTKSAELRTRAQRLKAEQRGKEFPDQPAPTARGFSGTMEEQLRREGYDSPFSPAERAVLENDYPRFTRSARSNRPVVRPAPDPEMRPLPDSLKLDREIADEVVDEFGPGVVPALPESEALTKVVRPRSGLEDAGEAALRRAVETGVPPPKAMLQTVKQKLIKEGLSPTPERVQQLRRTWLEGGQNAVDQSINHMAKGALRETGEAGLGAAAGLPAREVAGTKGTKLYAGIHPDAVKEALSAKSGPMRLVRDLFVRDQEFAAAKSALKAKERFAVEQAVAKGKPLANASPRTREMLKKVATGEVKIESLPKKMRTLVEASATEGDPALREIRRNVLRLVKLNRLDAKVAAKYTDAEKVYMRRLYYSRLLPDWKPPATVRAEAREFMLENAKRADGTKLSESEVDEALENLLRGRSTDDVLIPGLKKASGLFSSPLKARANVPEPLRKFMGEIQDGAHLAMLTLADQRRLIAHAKFYDSTLKQLPEIWKRHPNEAGVKLGEFLTQKGLTTYGVEQSKLIGQLWNQRVPKFLAEEILDMHRFADGYAKVVNQLSGVLKRKFTSYNPSTHFNNVLGNLMFTAGAGNMDPRSFAKALAAMAPRLAGREGGALWREAARVGAVRGTAFSSDAQKFLGRLIEEMRLESGGGEDISSLMSAWIRAKKVVRKGDDIVGGIYDAEDQVFKLATYIKLRSGKMSKGYFGAKKFKDLIDRAAKPGEDGAKAAAEYVHHFFPNYDWTGLTIRKLRQFTGSELVTNPFVMFPMEAARVSVNAFRARPIAVGGTLLALYSAVEYGRMISGLTEEQVEEAKADLPSYQREHLLVPYGEPDDIKFYDLTYKVPLASLLWSFKPNDLKEGPQLQERLLHAVGQTFGGGWLARDYQKDDPTDDDYDKAMRKIKRLVGSSREGATGWIPTPPSVDTAIKNVGRIKRGVEENKYGEPVPQTYAGALAQPVVGRPVYAASKRAVIEQKGLRGRIGKSGKMQMREAVQENEDEDRRDEIRSEMRERARRLRERNNDQD